MAKHSSLRMAILILSLLPVTRSASLLAGDKDQGFVQSNILALDEVPFELRNGHLIVAKGSLPGLDREVDVLIDTGAGITFVKKKLAKRLGLKRLPDIGTRCTAFGAELKIERVILRDLQLGHKLISRSCLAADLPWEGIDIVIGLDILQRTSLTIDYENSRLVFGGPSISDTSTALESAGDLLVTPVTMNGRTIRMAVDTGAHLTLVYCQALESCGKRFLGEKPVSVAHSSGFFPAQQIIPSSLQIGNVHIRRPPLAIIETDSGTSKIGGFLGVASIGLKRIHFDFENRSLSFE